MKMYDAALQPNDSNSVGDLDDPVAERLRRSETRLLLAIHGAGMGTWDIDWTTGHCIWSKSTFGMLGLPEPEREEADGTLAQWWTLIHPDDLPELKALIAQAAQEKSLYSGEYRIRRADNGELRWLSGHGRFFYDDKGRPIRFVGIAFDITQRRRAENRLRQTNDRLATALRAPHIILFSQDKDLRYTWIHNPALGYATGDVLGKTDRDLFEYRQDIYTVEALKRSVMATGRPLRQEICLHQEGGAYTYDLTLEPQRDQCGSVIGIMGVAVDVTASKRAQSALIESEARLRLALEAGSLGVWSLDLETDESDRSERHDQIFGYTEPQPKWGYHRFLDHVVPEDRDTVASAFQATLESRVEIKFACRIRRTDAVIRWIEVQGSPVIANGRIRRVIGIIGDITERKEAEAAVAKKRNELARLNRQKDTFFSIIAHDLRGPLATVAGFAEILRQDSPRLSPDEVSAHADSMLESCRQLYDLLENLLRWARVQMGEGHADPERFNLHRLANQARLLVAEAAGRKEIGVTLQVPDRTVIGDREAAATVLRNLLTNAVKFTPPGGHVSLEALVIDEDAPRVRWTVQDTGVGITQDQINKLFHLNGRNRTQGTAGETGSGLGLHLCHDLVQSVGGELHVDSEPGFGTRVDFTLPVTLVVGSRGARRGPPAAGMRCRQAQRTDSAP